jgi:hypothetical protein
MSQPAGFLVYGTNRPVYGRENVAKLLATLFRQGERLGVQAEFITVNGQPGPGSSTRRAG